MTCPQAELVTWFRPYLLRAASRLVCRPHLLRRLQAALARDAVDNLERLGPTFIKLGQIMSIRWVKTAAQKH